MAKALRADAERSVRAILEAAERVLADDPAATLEQIAEVAGVTRNTVHRRFANRQALLDALAVSAKEQLLQAIADGHPDSGPALVALHRVTAQVLRVKDTWRFSLSHGVTHSDAAAQIWVDVDAQTQRLLRRAKDEGLTGPAADLDWLRQVYYALLTEALTPTSSPAAAHSPDAESLASVVIDTLLYGAQGPV